MTESLEILAKVGPFSITRYGLMLALAAAVGILVSVRCAQRRGQKTEDVLSLAIFVIPGAILFGRLVYCATMISSFLADFEAQGGAAYMLQLWEGGYSVYGALLGGFLAAALWAKVYHHKLLPWLDTAAPGAAITICIGRIAEIFTSQGLGPEIENEALQRLPIAVLAPDGYYYMPIFLWEAVAALIIAAALLRYAPKYEGRGAGNFIVSFGLTQVILESLRRDEFIRFGFVRFNQLCAAATAALVLGLRIRRCILAGAGKGWQIARGVLFVLGAGLVILCEFALDKSDIDNRIIYVVMALTLVGMLLTCMIDGKKTPPAEVK